MRIELKGVHIMKQEHSLSQPVDDIECAGFRITVSSDNILDFIGPRQRGGEQVWLI